MELTGIMLLSSIIPTQKTRSSIALGEEDAAAGAAAVSQHERSDPAAAYLHL